MSGGDRHWTVNIVIRKTLHMQEPEASRGHLRHCDLCGAGRGGGGGPQAAGGVTGSAVHHTGVSVTIIQSSDPLTNAENSHNKVVYLLFSH